MILTFPAFRSLLTHPTPHNLFPSSAPYCRKQHSHLTSQGKSNTWSSHLQHLPLLCPTESPYYNVLLILSSGYFFNLSIFLYLPSESSYQCHNLDYYTLMTGPCSMFTGIPSGAFSSLYFYIPPSYFPNSTRCCLKHAHLIGFSSI